MCVETAAAAHLISADCMGGSGSSPQRVSSTLETTAEGSREVVLVASGLGGCSGAACLFVCLGFFFLSSGSGWGPRFGPAGSSMLETTAEGHEGDGFFFSRGCV
jgi:hypothetical protein